MEDMDEMKMKRTVFKLEYLGKLIKDLPDEYFQKRAQGPQCTGTLWPEVIESQKFVYTTKGSLILHALTGGDPALKPDSVGLAQKIAEEYRSNDGKPGEGKHLGAVLIPIIPYDCKPTDPIELRVHKMGWKPKYISQKKSVNQPYLMQWFSDPAQYGTMCDVVLNRGLLAGGKDPKDFTARQLAQEVLNAAQFGKLNNGIADPTTAKVIIEGEWKALTVGQTNLEKAVKLISEVLSSPDPKAALAKIAANPPCWYVPVGTIGVNGIYENVGSNKNKKYALNSTFKVVAIDKNTPVLLGPDGDIGTPTKIKVASVMARRDEWADVSGKPGVIHAMNCSANVLSQFSDNIRCIDLTQQKEKGFDDCIIDAGFEVGFSALDNSIPISTKLLTFKEIEERLLDGEKGMEILKAGPKLQQTVSQPVTTPLGMELS